MARIWPSLCESQRAIIIATARAFAGIERPVADAPAMSRPAALIFDALLSRPEHHAMSVDEMLDYLGEHRIDMSTATLRARVIPQLVARGATNTPRIGYSLPRRFRDCA